MLWNKKRSSKLIRRANGTFKKWIGGYTLSQMKKQENNFQGIAIHIGKEYKRQHGKNAKTGQIVRTKKRDGSYHKGASWYIKTPKGWRKSPTATKKPDRRTINKVIRNARKGRQT